MPNPPPTRAARDHEDRSRWFTHPAAHALMGAEQRTLIPSITGVFGQCGLYLRPSASAPAELSGNMVLSLVRLHGEGTGFDGDIRCEGEQLPIADDSMKLVYALHVFDTCHSPDALAREIARVLAPEGVAVVVGLNPFSPWVLRWAGRGPRVRSAGPVSASLALHGLQVFHRSGVGPVWPSARAVRSEPAPHRIDWLAAVRGGYALQARKRREGMTPLAAHAARPALALKPFGAHRVTACRQ